MPESLIHSLNSKLNELQLNNTALAVRSSGTLEDMPGVLLRGNMILY